MLGVVRERIGLPSLPRVRPRVKVGLLELHTSDKLTIEQAQQGAGCYGLQIHLIDSLDFPFENQIIYILFVG